MKITYKAIQAKMTAPTGVMEYDSTMPAEANDVNNPVGQMFRQMFGPMVGQSFTFKVTSKGKVVEIKGFQEMMEKMMNDNPAMAPMKEYMKSLFSEDYAKMIVSNSITPFPAQTVAVGDTWKDKDSINIGFPMEMENIYTLKNLKDGLAIIDVNSNMDFGGEEPTMNMGPMKMYMKMKGSCKGTTEIDEKTGWANRSSVKMLLSGKMEMVAENQVPQRTVIPMTIEGLVTVEPIEEKK